MKTTPLHFRKSISIQVLVVLLVSLFFVSCKDSNSTSSTSSDASSYTSKMTKSDKKKFFDASENVVYEVKYKDDGFKLRTASSDLIWKLKLYDDKIKISDNEENLNPYEIKLVSAQEAKLVKDDTEMARLKIINGSPTLTFKNGNADKQVAGNYAPSLLVNEISEIAEDQKSILINELKAKGY